MAKQKQLSTVAKLEAWQKTPQGLGLCALVEFSLTYALASLAIDNGSLLVYALTVIIVFAGVRDVYLLIKQVVRKK